MWSLPLTLMAAEAKFCLFLEIFAVFVNFLIGFTLPKMPIILGIFASSSTRLSDVL